MTDRFEESVRDAARGLGAGSAPGVPTYHDAWQRGRRRRVLKQSAMAAAGALVLVAALTANLGRFPGSDPTEVHDVAIGAGTAAASPVFVPTTAPIPTMAATVESQPSASNLLPTPAVSAESAPVESPSVNPAPTASAPTSVPPTPVPAESVPAPPTAVTVQPPAAATTAATQPATPDPAPTIGATAETQPTEPTPDPEPTTDPALASSIIIDDGENPVTGAAPQPADARFLLDLSNSDACQLASAPDAAATCELQPDYLCTGTGDVQPGYLAIDFDDDGQPDICQAFDVLVCDTTGDGLGDTKCHVILVDPAPVPAPEE